MAKKHNTPDAGPSNGPHAADLRDAADFCDEAKNDLIRNCSQGDDLHNATVLKALDALQMAARWLREVTAPEGEGATESADERKGSLELSAEDVSAVDAATNDARKHTLRVLEECSCEGIMYDQDLILRELGNVVGNLETLSRTLRVPR